MIGLGSKFAGWRRWFSRGQLPAETPEKVRDTYRHLYEEPVRELEDGASLGDARLWRLGRLNVLHLRGDEFEMAYQHGRLLRHEIGAGSIERAAEFTSRAVRGSLGEGPLADIVSWYARQAIGKPILRGALEKAAEMAEEEGSEDDHLWQAYGLSEGAGVPLSKLFQAVLCAETSQVLLGQTSGRAGAVSPVECTSFTAWGSATEGGELITGRNTDYPLTGYFDAHPTVIYFEPTGPALAHMTVTSAGFHNAGVCGYNEAGIYLAVHTVPSSRVSRSGLPVFMVGQEVLRRARTFDEARQLLAEASPAAGWNYHVVSALERKVATFELSCDVVAERPSHGDYHVTTNHWTQADMLERFLAVNDTMVEDSHARMTRVEQRIKGAGGALDAAGAASILADPVDPISGRVRLGANTVDTVHTVSSSVWMPDRELVYVSTGRAPTGNGPYLGLPTVAAFERESFAAKVCELKVEPQGPEERARAMALYIDARDALEYDDDAERAADGFAAAHRMFPDASMAVQWAIASVRVERYAAAERACTEALDLAKPGEDDIRRRLAHYIRGRVRAHRGETREAIDDLAIVAGDLSGTVRLRSAAQDSLDVVARRGRQRLAPRDLAPMGILPDCYRYSSLVGETRSAMNGLKSADRMPRFGVSTGTARSGSTGR